MKKGYVYILSNKARTTFYTGVTSNLRQRIQVHREGTEPAFSRSYQLQQIVYFEELPTVKEAIRREKQLKNWHREWKVNLIKKVNPKMKDLSGEIRW
jgi:putative endonuclease